MKLIVTQTDTLAQVAVRVQGIAPLPAAGTATLGGVMVGAGLVVDGNGVLSAPALSVAMGLVATGTTQADALVLTAGINVFTGVNAGTGCVLDVTRAQNAQTVVNKSGNDLLVYPPGAAQIDGGGAGVAVIVGPNQRVLFIAQDAATAWSAA